MGCPSAHLHASSRVRGCMAEVGCECGGASRALQRPTVSGSTLVQPCSDTARAVLTSSGGQHGHATGERARALFPCAGEFRGQVCHAPCPSHAMHLVPATPCTLSQPCHAPCHSHATHLVTATPCTLSQPLQYLSPYRCSRPGITSGSCAPALPFKIHRYPMGAVYP